MATLCVIESVPLVKSCGTYFRYRSDPRKGFDWTQRYTANDSKRGKIWGEMTSFDQVLCKERVVGEGDYVDMGKKVVNFCTKRTENMSSRDF